MRPAIVSSGLRRAMPSSSDAKVVIGLMSRAQLTFASLKDAVRADINWRIGWAKGEVRRQTRHTALLRPLSVVAALAAFGAIPIGLIAL
jgi:hypothetical protein